MKGLRVSFLTMGFLLLAATANDVFACSCVPGGSFLKVASKSGLVIRGRVLGHTGEGATKTEMNVEVLETLAGETSKSVVSISGDPGNQCRPYVSNFPVGTEWVFALEAAVKDALVARQSYLMSEPDKGDYAISNCGAYWLEVKEGKVSGNIDQDDEGRDAESQTLSLKELRRRFEAKKKARSPASPASHQR